MLRKLVASLVCAGMFGVSSAYALDLGALHVYSYADEPLDAEITLLEVEGFSAEDIKPRFAGIDDLAISGLDARGYLNGVEFFVVIEKDSSATLRLVSKKPIRSTFLSFLLELNWPEGRLLREYTSLLKVNPKAKMKRQVETKTASKQPAERLSDTAPKKTSSPVLAKAANSVVVPVAVEKPVPAKQTVTVVPASAPAIAIATPIVPDEVVKSAPPDSSEDDVQVVVNIQVPDGKAAQSRDKEREVQGSAPQVVDHSLPLDTERNAIQEIQSHREEVQVESAYRASLNTPPLASAAIPEASGVDGASKVISVGGKETLWDIAQRHRLSERHTNQQMMVALFEKNPQAFSDQNINRLKNAASMTLPTVPEVERYSAHDALVMLKEKLAQSAKLKVMSLSQVTTVERVTVTPKQTLWDLAVMYRVGPEVNTRQLMLAIVKKNPEAFEGGNINRMRKGVRLEMPTAQEFGLVSAEQASTEVRRQIADWRSAEGLVRTSGAENQTFNASVSEDFSAARVSGPSGLLDANSPPKVRIGAKETLWSIAINNMPNNSVTTGQMIKAIMAKNPHAFMNGNMNEMRVGAVLDMPTLREIERGWAQ